MNALRRVLVITVAATLGVIVWLLVESRPAFPTISGLTSTSNLDRLLGCLAWLGGLLLTLGLLGRLVRRGSHVELERPVPLRTLRRRESTRAYALGGYANRAFPLILRPRPNDDVRIGLPATTKEGRDEAEPRKTQRESRDGEESDATAPEIRVSVLGQLLIEGGRRHGRKLRGPSRDLLAYLALHQNGAYRDQLTDELWPNQSLDQARNRLYRAVADIRSHFGDALLIRDGEHYHLDRDRVSVDLDQLEQQQAALVHSQSADEELVHLEAALALFRGGPLAGTDLPWVENEQRRLHALRLELLERSGHNRLRRGDASGALADAEAGLADEPYNERLARLAMQAEAALGLRSAVITRYENLGQLLEEQLGLQPHRETRALYRQLLGQDLPINPRAVVPTPGETKQLQSHPAS
jgi:DNA-binding SARP family transcriptional activator